MRTGICLAVIWVGLMVSACSQPLPFDSGGSTSVPQTTTSPSIAHASPSPNPQAPYDLQVLDTLSRHHQDAVEMAKLAATKAQHRELKTFAQQMLRQQQSEIEQVQSWRNAWYSNQPAAVNPNLPGMQSMSMSLDKLQNLSGQEFDRQFITEMIPHHQGAVELARDMLNHSEHTQLKQLAAHIQEQQSRDIEQLRAWQTNW